MKRLFTFLTFGLIWLGLQAQNLNEGFEDTSFPPEGWTVINSGDANNWERAPYSFYCINGSGSAYIDYDYSTAHNDWLITPKLAPVDGYNTFSFYAKNNASYALDKFNVKLSTTGNNEEDFTVVLAENIEPTTTAAQYTYDLSAYNDVKVYIAVQAIANGNLILDDFAGPAIYQPAIDAALTSIENKTGFIGTHDVVVNLKNIGATELTACNINYTINSETPVTFNWTGTLAQGESETVTVATAYNFSTDGEYNIEASLELTGDEASGNNTISKTVSYYSALATPATEGFETTAEGELPLGWAVLTNTDTESSKLKVYDDGGYSKKTSSRTGSMHMEAKWGTNDWLYSREVSVESGKSYKFSIWYKTDGGTDWTILETKYGSNRSSAAMLNDIASVSTPTNTEYAELSGIFTATETGNVILGIHISSGYSAEYLAIDDISFAEVITVDATITKFTNPVTNLWETGLNDVKLEIKNAGLDNFTAATISWSVDGAPQAPYNWTGDLAPEGTTEITIGSYNFDSYKSFTIDAEINVENDGDNTNNSQQQITSISEPLELPFSDGFEEGNSDSENVVNWVQESTSGSSDWKANNTQTTYERTPYSGDWNACLSYSNSSWLFTPKAFYLEAGKTYGFSMYARQDATTGVSMKVSFGKEMKSEAMTHEIIASTEISNGDYQKLEYTFSPAENGYYYLGIFGELTGYSNWYLSIDQISLSEYLPVNFSVVNGNGSVSAMVNDSEINPGDYIEPSGSVVFTASPDNAYLVKEWTVNGTIVADNKTNTLTVSDIQEETTVTVEFEVDPTPQFTLNYTTATNGTIQGAATQTVYQGANGSEVTAVADAGYHFVQWSDGVTANPRTDENVTANITVEAQFEADPTPQYTLTYTAAANGTLEGTATQTVDEGSNGTAVTAVADAAYHFTQWSDGVTDNPRTDENVTADITVEAQFEADPAPQYTLTYTAAANGTLEGIATQTVDEGSNGTAVTAVANAAYHFTQWSDGVTENPRTDENVTADITVEAQFEVNVYNLSLYVTSNEVAVSGAVITINEQELKTDDSGEASIKLEDGTYDYSVMIEGYDNYTASLTINGADINENVSLTATSIDDLLVENIHIYPNPVADRLTLEKIQNVKSITIQNLKGQTIELIEHKGSEKINLNIENLSSGIYLFYMEFVNGDIIMKKVIKK